MYIYSTSEQSTYMYYIYYSKSEYDIVIENSIKILFVDKGHGEFVEHRMT